MGTCKQRRLGRHGSRGHVVGRALALIVGLALAFALIGAPMTSTIKLPKTAGTGSFARYVPFADRREVIVRRGEELGLRYGLELGRRKVKVEGGEFELVKYQELLSPPPLLPGQKPLSAEAAKQYKPVFEVLFLPDAEVLIPREPRGFTDAEVEKILPALSVR
jgi:hypothetical protein